MEILWLAIVLYSIGLGLVLHFKPALMFNENGTWKEFGYQRSLDETSRSRHTMFPFWLFAVSWAFASYAIAAAISWTVPVLGFGAAVATASFSSADSSDDYSSDEEATPVSMIPKRGRGRPRKSEKAESKPREGYYVVDPATQESGLRKYIYYGANPPKEE